MKRFLTGPAGAIAYTPGAMSNADPDSVDDVLGGDHAALGRVLEALTAAVDAGATGAAALLGSFSEGLRRHMEWEDGQLFPAVRAHATAAQRRSIESLEIDHERLRDTLKEFRAALEAGNAEDAARLVRWLKTLLDGHNYDEEHGVYVEADRYLPLEERRRLIAAFRVQP